MTFIAAKSTGQSLAPFYSPDEQHLAQMITSSSQTSFLHLAFGTPHSWSPHLSSFSSSVFFPKFSSLFQPLNVGVPLGPLLIYISFLGDFIQFHGFKFHFSSDNPRFVSPALISPLTSRQRILLYANFSTWWSK